MPAWLGVALAGVFTVVTAYRLRRRDAPAALMAAGMAVMAVGMGGIGPHLVHGPWWAAGFALVAAWPVLAWARGRAGSPAWQASLASAAPGHLGHLLGGAAMAYMCVAGLGHATGAVAGGSPAGAIAGPALAAVAGETAGTIAGGTVAGPALAAPTYQLAAHDHGGQAAAAVTGSAGGPVSAGLLALAGWLLACYFLLAAICALTRRTADGTPVRRPRSAAEAAMGLGTMIMLVAVL